MGKSTSIQGAICGIERNARRLFVLSIPKMPRILPMTKHVRSNTGITEKNAITFGPFSTCSEEIKRLQLQLLTHLRTKETSDAVVLPVGRLRDVSEHRALIPAEELISLPPVRVGIGCILSHRTRASRTRED